MLPYSVGDPVSLNEDPDKGRNTDPKSGQLRKFRLRIAHRLNCPFEVTGNQKQLVFRSSIKDPIRPDEDLVKDSAKLS